MKQMYFPVSQYFNTMYKFKAENEYTKKVPNTINTGVMFPYATNNNNK